ncbi:MAG: DNA repair protein RecN, partial [Bdellovibrionales bacterium]|nr:DNA repair protein RecN [Bdellovibrionales bacterium]
KSILVKSLALLMGAKSSGQDVRSGQNQARIEGAFDLSERADIQEKLTEMGIDVSDDRLIVRRVIQASGSSKVYLNGQLSSVGDLKKVVFPMVALSNPSEAPLIEITGQHENKDLMSGRYQMELLDQFCGNQKLRSEVEDLFEKVRAIDEKLEELNSLSMQREQRIDFLQFQISEIEELDLTENEDEILKDKIKEVKSQEKWHTWLSQAESLIHSNDKSILTLLKVLLKQAPDGAQIKKICDSIEQAYQILEDAAFELSRLQDRESASEEDIDEMESRLSRIRKLQKKFGEDVASILENLQSMKEEFEQLSNINETRDSLNKERTERMAKLTKVCQTLHKKRQEGSKLLVKEVNEELTDLNMKGVQFLIEIEWLDEAQAHGQDQVAFMTQTGKKDMPRPLGKAASGGELSRILLSLKQVIGASQQPRTYLFDEVDTGVSGPTAEKVGQKLKNISKHQQVICVTHLPQVASFGDQHYFIEKHPEKEGVHMSVRSLKKAERIDEIARLISGEKLTKTSLAHAKQLLSEAQN